MMSDALTGPRIPGSRYIAWWHALEALAPDAVAPGNSSTAKQLMRALFEVGRRNGATTSATRSDGLWSICIACRAATSTGITRSSSAGLRSMSNPQSSSSRNSRQPRESRPTLHWKSTSRRWWSDCARPGTRETRRASLASAGSSGPRMAHGGPTRDGSARAASRATASAIATGTRPCTCDKRPRSRTPLSSSRHER